MSQEIPEYERQRRVDEMLSDPHIREMVQQVEDLLEDNPDMTIYYQVSCRNCSSRLTDTDKATLQYYFLCDLCGCETKTSEGDLGYLSVLLPPHIREKVEMRLKDDSD